VPRWAIDGPPFPYTGGADATAGVDRGFRFALRDQGGRTASVSVERAFTATYPLTATDALRILQPHLDDPLPPQRILLRGASVETFHVETFHGVRRNADRV